MSFPSNRSSALDPRTSHALQSWLAVVDRAPPPKPLVMGGTMPPTAGVKVQTRWQPGAMPQFPIEPANDPVERLAADDRTSMTMLALVVCVTLTVALLGFGLQVLQ